MTKRAVTKKLSSVFSELRSPAKVISLVVMLCSLTKRPGLSCMLSTSKIIQDLSKRGVPTGPLVDGSPNLMNQLVASVVCEVFRALKEDANIQIAIQPGSINVKSEGVGPTGPITAFGTNISSAGGVGLLQ